MYSKLIVDGKLVYVYENGRVPNWIDRLLHMKGIEIKDASFEDRIKFVEMEKKLKEIEDRKKK
jgi:ABC-type glycerol-3-phosphate transport system substrate-binding protein